MVGYSPDSEPLSGVGYSVAGAGSGIITRCAAQPLDVLKIRFQLQVEPIAHATSSKYHGVVQACRCIYREEGLRAFWKGHVPAQGLSLVYGVVQFTSFELLTKTVWTYLPEYCTSTARPVTHFLCGGAAGFLAMLTSYPFDVIRTRFVAQGEPKIYLSLLHAARTMRATEGARAFYRGLTPAVLQVTPQTGLQFGFYAAFTSVWALGAGAGTDSHFGSARSLTCGALSGLCAKLSIYPLDMAKKRLQIQGFTSARESFGVTERYRGLTHCLGRVAAQEGLRGLYKGLSPSLLKAVVTAALNFWAYEWCCHLVRLASR